MIDYDVHLFFLSKKFFKNILGSYFQYVIVSSKISIESHFESILYSAASLPNWFKRDLSLEYCCLFREASIHHICKKCIIGWICMEAGGRNSLLLALIILKQVPFLGPLANGNGSMSLSFVWATVAHTTLCLR